MAAKNKEGKPYLDGHHIFMELTFGLLGGVNQIVFAKGECPNAGPWESLSYKLGLVGDHSEGHLSE